LRHRNLTSCAPLLLLFLLIPRPSAADLLPILPDGDFSDWDAATPLGTDASGDGGIIDFGRVWAANDQDWFFLRFETGGEIQPDEGQDLVIYLDTDLNPATGQSIQGMGADLVWELGNRTGTFYTPSPQTIDHPDIGLLIAPTVSGTDFEMAFDRHAVPAGGQSLFPAAQVRVVLEDRNGGDTAPSTGSYVYTFAAGSLAPSVLPTGRPGSEYLRLAEWNVQSDGLFNGGSQEAAQQRMAQVLDPDVFCFEEVWNHSASEVASQVEVLLPSGPGESWSALSLDSGNVICTRLPILDSWGENDILPQHRISAALLDASSRFSSDVLVVANHWRCCTADAERQDEADALVAFLADARSPGGVIDLPQDTPILITGDFNLVGLRAPLMTLITGDIADNATFGPDSPPDWDGSPLDVVAARHVDARESYTWRNDYSSFYPGLLDWVFYTGSAIDLGNAFVLETRTMQPSTLSALGLYSTDTFTASDHAPRAADFTLPLVTAADPIPQRLEQTLRVFPNPANPRVRIDFELARSERIDVAIYDAAGRFVRRLADEVLTEGPHELLWSGDDAQGRAVASGIYFVRVAGATRTTTRSVALVR
jgi:endonuclease/exonuclease/phosphatase family metal-dependent hydrolase